MKERRVRLGCDDIMSVAGISTIFSFLIKYSRNVSESNDCAMACTRLSFNSPRLLPFPFLSLSLPLLTSCVCEGKNIFRFQAVGQGG